MAESEEELKSQSMSDAGYSMLGAGCMGMTQRDVMGREVEGGFMFGNACKN